MNGPSWWIATAIELAVILMVSAFVSAVVVGLVRWAAG